ncbi:MULTISPECIES: AraC family transcriptional regulator [unclassified Paenibacillus]|uniref:AraC family transcriptional regulator n=1 Tax=unclassified Paenibacillus TaxID=185978 RepID=UPI00095403A0|nr:MULTISPECIES: AraC family transcriptional regulator [unclassified Paenibacillus]ASS66769.1 AraC family transcriptional regulator [Paenibacillus sp. RUD330]SIP96000.1 Helix-turn-helix domain-containing protein [Paenibacillus sp. RU4X]SIQ14497.1 Helix-turn-helix domain-containing protein [Paenibacillus sp. RU4T]
MEKSFYYKVVPASEGGAEMPLEVLFAGESQTKPGHRLGPKVHDFYLLHHVLSGKGEFLCRGAVHRLEAGQSFLIEPGQLVSYQADSADPWCYRWIAFQGPWAPHAAAAAGFDIASPTADTGRSSRPRLALKRSMRYLRQPAGAQLGAVACLHAVLAEFAAARGRDAGPEPGEGSDDGGIASQMIRYLSTQYAEPISMEGMAESFGYSRAYLSRVFKQHAGMSPVSFLLRLRIDKGRRMLRERRDLTVEQIASSVGLQDALYFSRQFRRFHGESPTDYRESVWHSLREP